jgi:hypothetical protein
MIWLAVCLLLMWVGTGKLQLLLGLYQIGWRPVRTCLHPFAVRMAITSGV